MRGFRLLVVNYDFPPAPSVGGMRWLSMRKYLQRMGHEVVILTTSAFGRLSDDDLQRVIRTVDLTSSPSLRRLLRRPDLGSPEERLRLEKPPSRLLTSVVVPDIYAATWAPFAIFAARRLVRDLRPDAIVTSSPKDASHLVGLATQSESVAWIAEFRDGWTYDSTRPRFPTAAQRALDRKLEELIVRRADAVVAVTDEIVDDFRRRLKVDAACVANGWDPELADVALTDDEPLPSVPRERPVRLVYTGTLTGTEGAPSDRSPMALLRALEALAGEDPDLAARIEFVVAGRRSTRDESILSRFARLGIVRHVGHVPRSTSIALQRSADALVLITGEATASPAKLFEYLGARRPILHLGRPGASSRLLERTGAGVTVAGDDVAAVVEQLRRIARSEFGVSGGPNGLEQYSYPHVAEQMAEVLERAIRLRAGSN